MAQMDRDDLCPLHHVESNYPGVLVNKGHEYRQGVKYFRSVLAQSKTGNRNIYYCIHCLKEVEQGWGDADK